MGQVRRILLNIIDMFFPQVCGICGILNENSLCKKCELKLEKIAKCEIEEKNKDEFNFEELIYLFQYEGIIRKLIIDYKFNEKAYLYKTILNFLLKNKKILKKIKTYDTIMPVPISKKRNKERGYNQSLIISKEISKIIGLSHISNALIKNKNIVQQSKLNKEDRIKNVQGVYDLKNKQRLTKRKILLVDDIYTTGSTVNECCKILRKANLEKIGVFTIAKD